MPTLCETTVTALHARLSALAATALCGEMRMTPISTVLAQGVYGLIFAFGYGMG